MVARMVARMVGGRLLVLGLTLAHASPLDPPGAELYETAYACEASQLNITCAPGLHLNVIRANYGRFSIAICNVHGNTGWSVNCMSPRTLRVIRARCQGGQDCRVPVDSTIFGDPCPGTYKYVEVHYSCDREVTRPSTARPRPPWLPSPPPHSWQAEFSKQAAATNQTNSTGQTDEIHPPAEVEQTTAPVEEDDTDTEDMEDESTPAEIDIPKVIKVKVPKPLDDPSPERRPNLRIPVVQEESVPTVKPRGTVSQPNPGPSHGGLPRLLNTTAYCPPTTARTLYWNWTMAGDTAVLQCPPDSTGFAKWRCGHPGGGRAEWTSPSPTLAECQSKWLNNLDSRLRAGEAISTVSGDLAQLSGLQQMYGGDLQLSSRMLKHMAERMHYDMQGAVSAEDREAMVTQLVQNVATTGSNILARVNHMSWADLSQDDVAAAATSLMVGLEENAFLLADAVTTEKIIIKPTTNILLSIRVMEARSTPSQRFPAPVETLEMWETQEDAIELSSAALQENSENGAVRIIFATYKEFDQLLVPSQRVNASLRFVNSKVISASLGKARHTRLPDTVKITLKHLKTHNVSAPVCVFWDYAIQAWSNEGCRMVATNRTHTRCECDHLTNFALIMEEGEAVEVTNVALPSHVTTIIACVATLVCVTLMMFALVITWRKFRVTHQCRSILQKSGIPCFHKTKELSEKDKKQGNFYTVTPKLNGSVGGEPGKAEANIEMDNQQYFEHLSAMQKNQESLVLNKTMNRRNTMQNNNLNEQQETNLNEMDLAKSCSVGQQNLTSHTVNNKKSFKAKTQCQHAIPNGKHNEFVHPKRSNVSRAMSPHNHIYMEIDPKTEEGAMYEALGQSEAGSRGETYMVSSLSDMSDDSFRRCSDMSRQSSSRYAEHRPLIPGTQHFTMDSNLLTTINSVMHSQSVRVANPQHHHRTSILSTISGLRYTDPSQPGLPSLPALPATLPEPPVQVTTTRNGDQFVCLNLNDQNGKGQQVYASLSDTYVTNPDLQQQLQHGYMAGQPVATMQRTVGLVQGVQGVVQAPVHSQLVVQRVGTLPRQFAHPLAPQ